MRMLVFLGMEDLLGSLDEEQEISGSEAGYNISG
jgi:hypothetical protein